MERGAWEDGARTVHHFHGIPIDRTAPRYVYSVDGGPNHRFAFVGRPRHVYRRQFDRYSMLVLDDSRDRGWQRGDGVSLARLERGGRQRAEQESDRRECEAEHRPGSYRWASVRSSDTVGVPKRQLQLGMQGLSLSPSCRVSSRMVQAAGDE